MATTKKQVTKKSHASKGSRGKVDKNFIGLTSKVFNILEALGTSRKGTLTLEEVTRQVKLAKTTVHRLLYSLTRIGYVEKDEPTGRYGLSAQFFELGRSALPHQYLSSLARPLMKNLVDRFGASVNLGVLDEDRIVYVAVVESPNPFRCAATVGESCYCHCTSMGKSMLAYLPERDFDRILVSQGLPRMTDRTLTSKEALLAELARVRKAGVAMDRGENIEGVMCVGAPILDQDGRPIAGISASGPAALMQANLETIEAEVRRISIQLSKMVGHA